MAAQLTTELGRSPVTTAGYGRMEKFSYDDAVVRKFLIATLIWGLVAFLVGLIVAFELVLPTILKYVPWLGVLVNQPDSPLNGLGQYLTFGRLRPLHTTPRSSHSRETPSSPRSTTRRSACARPACGATC